MDLNAKMKLIGDNPISLEKIIKEILLKNYNQEGKIYEQF